MKALYIISRIMMGTVLIITVFITLFVLMPELAGAKVLVVVSGSMEPEISVGSLVVVYPSAASELKVGDDISYYLGESDVIVTHRVVAVDYVKGTVDTKGIANNTKETGIPMSDVVGKVRFHMPYVGFLADAMNRTSVKIMTILALMAVIALAVLVDELCGPNLRAVTGN